MNRPVPCPSSLARRTWFQTSGASCHSSSRRGSSPSSTRPGTTDTDLRALRSRSNSTSLRAKLRPVHVLPHPLGPSMTTAGIAASALATAASATRSR